MTVGSLFSGVGGFDLGFEQAGFTVAWQVEADDKARKVLRHRWPDVPIYDDVRTVGAHNLAPVDVLVGGFPCQDLSVAGKREGLTGARSGLFYEFMRIARELRPDWVVLENVPGLLTSHGGRDFHAVLAEMADSGFHDRAYRVLDSRYFGVPQRRRRVFLVGRAGAEFGRAGAVLLESSSGGGDSAAGRATGARVARGVALQSLSPGEEQRRRIYDADGVSPSLGAGGTGGQNVPSVAYALRRDPGGIGQGHNCTYVPFTQNQRDEVRELGDTAGCLAADEGMKQRTYVASFQQSSLSGRGTMGYDGDTSVLRPVKTQADHQFIAFDWQSGGKVWHNAGDKTSALTGHQTPAVYQCHGNNVGPMGTLRQGRGDVQSGVPFVASALSASLGHHGHSSPRGDGSDNLVAATLNSGGFRTEPGEHLVPSTAHCLTGTMHKRHDDDTDTLIPQHGVRRLTPLECERLQGFPDMWTCLCGAATTAACTCSDSPRYKQMGNAVTVPVIRWIAQRLKAVAAQASLEVA